MNMTAFLVLLVPDLVLWAPSSPGSVEPTDSSPDLSGNGISSMEHLGVRDFDPARDQLGLLLRGGKKIQAATLYRDITGAELVEAKSAVERPEAQL